jgi:2-polyprenyl-3-methyl-5-hydroxy-6-metoxy-1,4-benzoquinol methylase
MVSKEAFQEVQYKFPYHHIPHFIKTDTPMLSRKMAWGFEYLGYIEVVRQLMQCLEPNSILEVGCGDGRVLSELAGLQASRHGCDLSEKAIAHAKAFDPSANYCCGRAELLHPWTYSAVLAVETLEHIPTEKVSQFLKALWNLVEKDGYLVLTVPSDARPTHRKHYQHFNCASLKSQIEKAIGRKEIATFEICSESKPISFLQKLLMNRLWYIEIPHLNKWMWSVYQRINLRPKGRRGTHVVAYLCKREV